MNDTELDIGIIRAHWRAVAPMYIGEPHSVMYMVVVKEMYDLIEEVERLRKKYES